MAELDLDALEQAAREAGGGCWFSAGWTVGSRGFEVGDLKSRDRICSDATERCAEFIAAANPATILEFLGRLKAAEKERDALRAENAGLVDDMNLLRDNNTSLRAKIAEMEQQEPAGEVVHNGESAGLYNILEHGALLYALPGAQPAPSVPDVDALAQFIREIDGAHQLGAGVLAERIVEWLAAPEAKP